MTTTTTTTAAAALPDRLPMQRRAIAIDLDALRAAQQSEGGDDAVPITIASETPYQRWWGTEILDLSPDAVDMTYGRGGLALLYNHNPDAQIGVIEQVTVGSDRKLRGLARFSDAAEAQQIKRDIAAGIRRYASVGYVIRELTLEKSSDEEGHVYRVNRWMPYEGSIVSIPADVTVGPNRGAPDEATFPVVLRSLAPTAPQAKEITVPENATAAPSGATPTTSAAPAAPAVPAVDRGAERARELAQLAQDHQRVADLPTWLASNRSVDEVRTEIMESYRARLKPVDTTPRDLVDLPASEQKRYSISRAIMNRIDGKRGLESEVSDEVAKKFGRDTRGVYVLTGRALDTKTTAGAKELVFTEYGGEFIEVLRNNAVTMKLGIRMLPGLTSNIAFPRQTGAATAYWVGDNPGVGVTASQFTTDLLTMSPKQLQASTKFSRMLLQQSSVSVDASVRDDIAQQHAIAVDLAVITGTGASNQPTGILNTTGVTVVSLGTNGAQPVWSDVTNLEYQVALSNAMLAGQAFLTTPGLKNRFKNQTPLSNTVGLPIWQTVGGDPFRGEMNGYPAWASTQVPNNLTKGTSSGVCHAAIFGAWPQVYLGEWGAMELIPDALTLADQGLVKITSIQMVDILVRHGPAFAVWKDALL